CVADLANWVPVLQISPNIPPSRPTNILVVGGEDHGKKLDVPPEAQFPPAPWQNRGPFVSTAYFCVEGPTPVGVLICTMLDILGWENSSVRQIAAFFHASGIASFGRGTSR